MPSVQHLIRHKMEVMKRWFHTLDADGSGNIGPEELEDPLVSVGLAGTHQVRHAAYARIQLCRSRSSRLLSRLICWNDVAVGTGRAGADSIR